MHFYVFGFESLGTSERKVEILVRNLSRGTIFRNQLNQDQLMTFVGGFWLRDGGEALAREDIDVGIDDDERW